MITAKMQLRVDYDDDSDSAYVEAEITDEGLFVLTISGDESATVGMNKHDLRRLLDMLHTVAPFVTSEAD
jgi:hypothetical protein